MNSWFFNELTRRRLSVAILFSIVLALGCTQERKTGETNIPIPNGVFVRHLRIKVETEDVEKFESTMLRIAKAAEAAKLRGSYDWLCYREATGYYWILFFGDGLDDFSFPGTLKGLAERVAQKIEGTNSPEIVAMAQSLNHLKISEVISQQNSDWSTTGNVESREYPKARIFERKIKANSIGDFDRLASEWTKLLNDNRVTRPIESFLFHSPKELTVWSVVFLKKDESFDVANSTSALIPELTEGTKSELARIETQMDATIQATRSLDGQCLHHLSFGTK